MERGIRDPEAEKATDSAQSRGISPPIPEMSTCYDEGRFSYNQDTQIKRIKGWRSRIQ